MEKEMTQSVKTRITNSQNRIADIILKMRVSGIADPSRRDVAAYGGINRMTVNKHWDAAHEIIKNGTTHVIKQEPVEISAEEWFAENGMTTEIERPSVKFIERQIQTTSDFSIFRFMEGNRPTNVANTKDKVRSIKNNIENEIVPIYQPIIVNENMEICEGQHRFEALKKLSEQYDGVYVEYIVTPGMTLGNIQEMQNGKSWMPEDYLNSFIESGNNNYRIYKDFRETVRMPNSPKYYADRETLMGVLTNLKQNTTRKVWNEGNLEIDPSHLPTARKWMDWIVEIEKTGFTKGWHSVTKRTFYLVLVEFFRYKDKSGTTYNHKRMMSKLSGQSKFLFNQGKDNFRNEILKLYNGSLRAGRIEPIYLDKPEP